jgi:type I restriction enzyme S subunit
MGVRPGYKQTEVGVIPEDWDPVALGEIGVFSKGQGIKKDEASSGDIPCVRYGELYTHHNDIIHEFNSFISDEVSKSSKKLKKGDILFAGSGETKGEIGKCAAYVEDKNAFAGGDIVILSPQKGDSTFLGYLLNTPSVIKQKASKGQGDAIVHISAKALASIQIPFPSLSEQRAISTVLNDVDAMIESLDKLIAKKRDIKQAAMQSLLTGKIRLPEFCDKWEKKKFNELAFLRRNRIDPNHDDPHEFCIELENIEKVTGRLMGWSEPKNFSSLKTSFDIGDVLFGKLRAYLRKYWLATRPGVCSTEIWVLSPKPNHILSAYLYQLVTTNWFIDAAINAYGTHMPRSDWKVIKELEVLIPKIPEQSAIAEGLSDMDAEIETLEKKRSKTRLLKQGMMQELLTGKTRLI